MSGRGRSELQSAEISKEEAGWAGSDQRQQDTERRGQPRNYCHDWNTSVGASDVWPSWGSRGLSADLLSAVLGAVPLHKLSCDASGHMQCVRNKAVGAVPEEWDTGIFRAVIARGTSWVRAKLLARTMGEL